MAGGTASKDDLQDWHDKLGETLDQLTTPALAGPRGSEEVRVDQATLYRRLHVLTTQEEPQKEWIELESQQLDRLVELGENNLLHLKSVQHRSSGSTKTSKRSARRSRARPGPKRPANGS